MKINRIRKIVQLTQNLYEICKEIAPEDVLKIIRTLSKERKYLGYDPYGTKAILYTTKDMTKEEFDILLEKTEKTSGSITMILDQYFQRDDIAEKVKEIRKVKSSTTKAELISFLATNPDLLYQDKDFREKIIDARAGNKKNFCEGKTLISSPIGNYTLVFTAYETSKNAISGKLEQQFWKIIWEHSEKDKIYSYDSKLYNNFLFLNLKDPDEKLLGLIKTIPPINLQKEIDIEIYSEEIRPKDLGFSYPNEILYPLDIDQLSTHFGKRHGSKFETFASGLENKADIKKVKQLQGKRFLITSSENNKLYFGKNIDKEIFEKIACYLSIEYIEDENIICKLGKKQTREVISAIWAFEKKIESWRRNGGKKIFYVIQLD